MRWSLLSVRCLEKRSNSSHAQLGLLTDSTPEPETIARQGVVRRCEDPVAFIELHPPAGCAGCERQRRAGFGPGHCGIDLLGLSKPAQNSVVEVPSQAFDGSVLKPGDAVEVNIQAPNKRWVALACRVYGVPTVGLVLGASLGGLASELAALLLAALGLFAGLWFGRRSVHVPQSITELCITAQPGLRIVNVAFEARS